MSRCGFFVSFVTIYNFRMVINYLIYVLLYLQIFQREIIVSVPVGVHYNLLTRPLTTMTKCQLLVYRTVLLAARTITFLPRLINLRISGSDLGVFYAASQHF